jgi:farnesyl diphosphate synthase
VTTPDLQLRSFAEQSKHRVEIALNRILPETSIYPARLHEAMRYCVLNGGKRIRPLLTYAAGQACEANPDPLDMAAAAVELIHAYSLVHDDLPAMDNDDLRRGQPTCHKAFGEAEAILAGDAILTLAFRVLSHHLKEPVSAERRLHMIELLSHAAGSRGMVGGQSIDLASVGKQLDIAELEDMHIHKTGALIKASVLLGALCGDTRDDTFAALTHYAQFIGLAFQVQDDILDVTGSTEQIGKTARADQSLNKPTYPALLGLAGAREHAQMLHESAIASLEIFDEAADPLRWLSAYIVARTN